MKTLQGDWRATVINIKHPQGLMKAQIRVNGFMDGIPDEVLPWAEYLLPIGYEFIPCNVGDLIWVDFPYDGDTRRPRIKGAAMDWAQAKPNTAPEAGGKGTAYTPDKVDDRPNQPKYNVTQDRVLSRNGILEVRSIGGGYMIANMAKHASVGFNEDGDIVLSTTAGVFIHSDGNTTIDAGGDMLFRAKGKVTMQSGQDMSLESKAKLSATSANEMTMNASGNMNLTAKGAMSQTATGDFTMKGAAVTSTAQGSMTFNGSSSLFKAGSFSFGK